LNPPVETADFVPVRLVGAPDAQASAPSPEQAGSATGGEIVIELVGGRRLRVDRHVDAEALRRVLRVLDGP
jgi:transposase